MGSLYFLDPTSCSLTTAAPPEEAIEYSEQKKKRLIHPLFGAIWFSVLYFGVVGMTLAVMLGCWSPATEMFSVFDVDVHQIASYLSNATTFNETQFQHPDLPDSWSFGFSGTCELYVDTSKHTKCYHAFPPLFSIEDLVQKALHDSSDASATISSWTSALASKPSNASFTALTKYTAQRKQSVSLFRGAAAVIVFSFFLALCNFASSLIVIRVALDKVSTRIFRRPLYGAAVVDFVLYGGAVACFGAALITGPGAFARYADMPEAWRFVEVGPIIATVALFCRIFSIPVLGLVFLVLLGVEIWVGLLLVYGLFRIFMLFLSCCYDILDDR